MESDAIFAMLAKPEMKQGLWNTEEEDTTSDTARPKTAQAVTGPNARKRSFSGTR